jgi:hypothetical protein
MPYRDVNIEHCRAALAELRSAHRILLALTDPPPPVREPSPGDFGDDDVSLDRLVVRGIRFMLLATDETSKHATNREIEIQHARQCIERACTQMGQLVPATLEIAPMWELQRMVRELFQSIRDSDPSLMTELPLSE